eukprot:Gregarina_sp_Pseudo_9__1176@NODE_1774_length_1337_cov_200_183359_g1643_i0_p1_GENE_NODE_1774_length_1337_cov_200_183359_g1643_i0NODE_1774_length_1337_cov_200_183359_g1643_i0_p1_ORF_typecomplete_len235_score5_80_NODE_1774_length_1337_cov_200_183359_g1643_i05291233
MAGAAQGFPLDVTSSEYERLKRQYPDALGGSHLLYGSPGVENVVVYEADFNKVPGPADDQFMMCRVHSPHVHFMPPFTVVHYRFVVMTCPAPSVGVAFTRADGIGENKPMAVLCNPQGCVNQMHLDNNSSTKGTLFYHNSSDGGNGNAMVPLTQGTIIDCILEIHSSKVDMYVVRNDFPLGRVFQMAVEDSVPSIAPIIAFHSTSQGAVVAVVQHRLLPPPEGADVPYRFPCKS